MVRAYANPLHGMGVNVNQRRIPFRALAYAPLHALTALLPAYKMSFTFRSI